MNKENCSVVIRVGRTQNNGECEIIKAPFYSRRRNELKPRDVMCGLHATMAFFTPLIRLLHKQATVTLREVLLKTTNDTEG